MCHHTAVIRWTAAAGAFVVSLDSTMNIAFPAIAAAFAVPPERVRWVIVCYVLVYVDDRASRAARSPTASGTAGCFAWACC